MKISTFFCLMLQCQCFRKFLLLSVQTRFHPVTCGGLELITVLLFQPYLELNYHHGSPHLVLMYYFQKIFWFQIFCGLSCGAVNKCLLAPDMAHVPDQINYYMNVQIIKPIGLLASGTGERLWHYLKESRLLKAHISLDDTHKVASGWSLLSPPALHAL